MEKTLKVMKHSTTIRSRKSFDTEIIEPASKYKPLKRYDFHMNVYEKWFELKCQNPPKRRSYHVSFIHKDFLYILGGLDLKEGRISDISCLSLNFADEIKWKNLEVTGDIPEPLSDNSGVLVEDNFFLFGGENAFGETKNSLYILNLNTLIWEKKKFPLATIIDLSNHSCSYYKEKNSLVIFGGYNKGKYINDIYIYKIKEEEWNKIEINLNSQKVPEGRIKHSANIIDDYIYVYAGQNVDGNYLSDLWKFDLLNFKWEQITYKNLSPDDIPSGRSGHSSIYNSKDHSLYIFGGKVNHAQERNELWKFDINEEQFKLIHDTLLEMESDLPHRSIDINKIKQNSSNKVNESLKSHIQSHKNFTGNDKYHDNFEDMVLGSPNTKKIKLSMVYRMEIPDYVLRQRTTMLDRTNHQVTLNDRFKLGIVPEPRDGHTAEIYKDNMMIIFGGDRNKFSFNDLHIFNI